MAGLFSKLFGTLVGDVASTTSTSCGSDGWCSPSSNCPTNCQFSTYNVKSNNDVTVYSKTSYT